MELLLHLFTFLIYNTQIMQVHSGIAVQDLQNESGFHIGKEITYSSLHKPGKHLGILQTYGKNHLLGNNNTKRDSAIPVLVIAFLDHRNIYQDQCIIIFHFNTRTLFLIQRSAKIIYFDSESFGHLKDLSCSGIGHCNPAILLWFLNLMDRTLYCLKNPYHKLHSFQSLASV